MNPYEMLKNLPGLSQKAHEMTEKMKTITATGTSGAGLIKVTMNGGFEVTSVSIDPAIFKPEQAQTVEVLLASAINSAVAELKAKAEEVARSNFPSMPFQG
ncbi:MAG: YbaB/EbfC family nucleoid-associated protein [Sphaerochaetaceae bacterium]|jgi:DNA-binding YbaB/EbfC family protein|nr:YbaB/EbfC family nucleoid-associated protein [Sphaerochaetaceae bacterium]MDD3163917.1 YbaB/EbfC family nucleoid-associated protein [Sphaerochaetaceae bacterium]MDD4008062.1 YbaB/EbfC family nucleoid-associated protein [Sphaerochaetaceae bacterium]MDD4397283.1 YbaB/EbfC family nucleoid-associated protein [Sphaerochaetaceae bacterium]